MDPLQVNINAILNEIDELSGLGSTIWIRIVTFENPNKVAKMVIQKLKNIEINPYGNEVKEGLGSLRYLNKKQKDAFTRLLENEHQSIKNIFNVKVIEEIGSGNEKMQAVFNDVHDSLLKYSFF